LMAWYRRSHARRLSMVIPVSFDTALIGYVIFVIFVDRQMIVRAVTPEERQEEDVPPFHWIMVFLFMNRQTYFGSRTVSIT